MFQKTELKKLFNVYYAFFFIFTLFSVPFLIGVYRWEAPANIGFYMTPFRHAREKVMWGNKLVDRSEVGCENESSEFRWIPFDRGVIANMGGSHHRKIRAYAILSGYLDDPESNSSRRVLETQVCKPSQFSWALKCRVQTKYVGIRTFNLNGKKSNERIWSCD